MPRKPILILQMQRMGDLILSFPLFLWLHREYPGHPLWVVGEPRFYEPLLPLSPAATYIPWSAAQERRAEKYALCINLSHEKAAAILAGKVAAEQIFGAVESADGIRHVHGRWQLYRTGLVQANRHNRFHWAELNALDCIPLRRIKATRWPAPRTGLGDKRRIGLFLGASEDTKRPAASFWADLARELLHRDLRPILLGGPGDRELAREVQRLLGRNILNVAGRLSLAQFADFGQSLELMVTPDTGPMHLAAWTGLRVLNLSMGPVNPWETGPYQPGHYVLQARMSCAGCWRCSRAYNCHAMFSSRRIARMVHVLTAETSKSDVLLRGHGLRLSASARSPQGLYDLENVLCPNERRRASDLLGSFWTQFWGHAFGLWPGDTACASWNALKLAHPLLAQTFVRSLPGFHRKLLQARDASFWKHGPSLLRPLFSHAHLLLQNADFSKESGLEALKITEELLRIVAGEQ